jgi:hypothetical protein
MKGSRRRWLLLFQATTCLRMRKPGAPTKAVPQRPNGAARRVRGNSSGFGTAVRGAITVSTGLGADQRASTAAVSSSRRTHNQHFSMGSLRLGATEEVRITPSSGRLTFGSCLALQGCGTVGLITVGPPGQPFYPDYNESRLQQ